MRWANDHLLLACYYVLIQHRWINLRERERERCLWELAGEIVADARLNGLNEAELTNCSNSCKWRIRKLPILQPANENAGRSVIIWDSRIFRKPQMLNSRIIQRISSVALFSLVEKPQANLGRKPYVRCWTKFSVSFANQLKRPR